MFKEQKETMIKELKEEMRTTSHQTDNINKKIEIFKLLKRTKWKIQSKHTTEMKNSLEGPCI